MLNNGKNERKGDLNMFWHNKLSTNHIKIAMSIIDIAKTVTVTNAISMNHVFHTSNKYISQRYYKGGIGYGVEQNEK